MKSKTNNTIQAFWVGIGSLSSFALGIISAAILSRYFDKTEYGTYRQILYVYNTLLVIFSAGLPRVFAYFLPRFPINQGKKIVWKISKMLFLFGMVFSIFLFVSSDIIAKILKNPELAIGLKYFSPIPMFLLPTLGIEGIFSTYKKTIYIAIYNTLSRTLMLFFIVLPVILLKGTYLYAIYGWIVVSVISLIIAYFFKGIPFKKTENQKAVLSFKEIFSYSLPLVTASIAGIAIKSADQFYISRFFGPAVFAEFANGFIQLPFVGMITGATSVVLMPTFSKMIHDKTDINKISEIWQSALIKSAVLIYPILVFFIFHANSIIVLLYSDIYKNSAIYFQIAMIINFFNIVIFAPLLFSLGETKYYSRVHIVFAIFAWLGEYLIIILINSPVAIAVFSVLLSIAFVIVAIKKISVLLNLSFLKLFPVKHFSALILHSLIIIILIKIINKAFMGTFSNISLLLINIISFLILILLTSKFFKLDYLMTIRQLIKNNT
jgi:O-antigen/teichoic acid export membrane protein